MNTPTCEACAMLADDRDMTAEEAKTATLCGDCQAFFGIGNDDTHTEPCEECGAVMTYDYTVDEWSHENTPTAGGCYTAFRWGVK